MTRYPIVIVTALTSELTPMMRSVRHRRTGLHTATNTPPDPMPSSDSPITRYV